MIAPTVFVCLFAPRSGVVPNCLLLWHDNGRRRLALSVRAQIRAAMVLLGGALQSATALMLRGGCDALMMAAAVATARLPLHACAVFVNDVRR